MRLGEILVANGLATPDQVSAALERQKQDGCHIGATLVAMGVISIQELLNTLKYQLATNTAVESGLQTVERWTKLFGAAHPDTLRARSQYARALLTAGRPAEALSQAEAALSASRQGLGPGLDWSRGMMQLVTEAKRAISADSRHASVEHRLATA